MQQLPNDSVSLSCLSTKERNFRIPCQCQIGWVDRTPLFVMRSYLRAIYLLTQKVFLLADSVGLESSTSLHGLFDVSYFRPAPCYHHIILGVSERSVKEVMQSNASLVVPHPLVFVEAVRTFV